MTSIATTWDGAASRQPAIGFVDVVLRGGGQVMFQNNPLTGLLFIVGIAWGAGVAGTPAVAVGAVVGLLVSTITAYLLRVDRDALQMGLYGYNGILVGAALPTFLTVDALLWAYIVVGAAVSTIALLAIANVMKTWGAPALTFPFVLTTWLMLLGAYAFANVPIASMGPPALPVAATTGATVSLNPQDVGQTLLVGISQVFLINNAITGIIFLIALAVSSPWSAAFAALGTALAFSAAATLGADPASVSAGLFGFSAVLTAIALGSVFYTPGIRVLVYAVVGIIFTVVVQGALDVLLSPVGIPTLTAPFVVATWLFLLPKENFAPVPHRPIPGGAATSSGSHSDA